MNQSEKNNRYAIITLNYILKFIDGTLVGKDRKDYAKPFRYLNKYVRAIEDLENSDKCTERAHYNTIWQCWLQGEDNMPELVKVCTESVKRHNKDREIVLITEQNYNQFINLPDFVIEKYKKEIIPKAQFSDIIRLALLEKYGGVWIDSTMFETGELPKEIFSSEFFTYKNPLELNFKNIKNFKQLEIMCNYLNMPIMLPSTWFISSAPNNVIVSGWLKLLLEYWKNENTLIEYFIMDYFFVLLLLNNDKCRKIFSEMPTYSTAPVHVLASAQSEDYDKEMFEEIKQMTPIHKMTLNYTPDPSNKNKLFFKILEGEAF